jgi:hypothetical protein
MILECLPWLSASDVSQNMLVVCERLTRVETMLEAHMANQDKIVQHFLYPTMIGVVLMLIRIFGADLLRFRNHRNNKGGGGNETRHD